jgi:uncharacterized protein (DUF1330 family)
LQTAESFELIVRGGRVELREGEWQPSCLVVLKFESAERAREVVVVPGVQRTEAHPPTDGHPEADRRRPMG